MEDSDRVRFASVIGGLCLTFGRDTSPELVEVYWRALHDLPITSIETAAEAIIARGQFFPRPAEIRDRAGGAKPLTLSDRSLIAWERVIETIRETSGYYPVDFDDRIINATIRGLGGWQRLCDLPSEELHRFTVKDFRNTYEALAKIAETLSDESTAPLPGMLSQQCEPEHADKLQARSTSVRLITTGMPSLIETPARKQIEASRP